MIPETEIDYKRSIETGWLKILPWWSELADIAVIVVLSLVMIFCPLLLYKMIDFKNQNDIFLAYFLFPVIILAGLIILYKKIFEKKLVVIDTNFDIEKNKLLTIEFLNSEGFESVEIDNKIIIGLREGDFVSSSKQVIIIPDYGKVYVCVLILGRTARFPSLFFAKSVIKDFRNFISNQENLNTN